jgi:phosphoenolpyruvate carboxykinase (ATP)
MSLSISSPSSIFTRRARTYHNLSTPALIEMAVTAGEGTLTAEGALAVTTGKYTGRSPKDRFIVSDSTVRDQVDWGPENQPMEPDLFERLYEKVILHMQDRELFVFDGFAGADAEQRLPIRIVTESAWQNLFVHQLFVRPTADELRMHTPQFTVICMPSFKANPQLDGTRSEAFVLISFEHQIVLIGGTEYAGEMKKSIFSVMNYLLPGRSILPMHCSANIGPAGDVALFFGLSGTGKTTLSADPQRRLIGDDEHAWTDNGIFNIEGGCYAKCINLSVDKEPQIFSAIRFGSVLENVIVDPASRLPDYDNEALTENTRAAYPVDFIPGAVIPGLSGHPGVVIFLTADAFGVLPPIARLSTEQTMYHFLSGYTSKLAGTERGITTPEATFSACFGSPFLPLPPATYARLLGEKMERHGVHAYLVNTGWSGGPYGVGERMKLSYTRAMVHSALNGELDRAGFVTDPIFQVSVPLSCPGVPDEVLQPRKTWSDPSAYDAQARKLAALFATNFARFKNVPELISAAGPRT